MKRILAVMMALAMLLTCAAALAENTYPLTDSGETFKLIIRMRPLHSDANEMELFQRMEEYTGVHIDWEQIPQA